MNSPVCPLCGSGTVPWFVRDRGVIFLCRAKACGVGFIEPQPDDEELAALYERYYYPEHGAGAVFENSTIGKFKQHFEALDRRLNVAGKTVLDYGCGVGNFLQVAQGHGCRVAGVEFDGVARAEAARRGFRVERRIDAFDEGSFDLVYMNDVIEHLRDPVEVMRLVRARIAPGGAAFVVTMNMRGLTPRVRRGRWSVVTNPTHFWFYDETSLTATLRTAGFRRVRIERWPVRFDHHGVARGVVQRLLQTRGWDASLRALAWTDAEQADS